VAWYLDHLENLIPRDGAARAEHPKADATVRRVVDIWQQGEKVLVFCHYVVTGRILRQRISDAIQLEIRRLGAAKLGCAEDEVGDRLDLLGERFFDADSPIRRACDAQASAIVSEFPDLESHREDLIEIVRRNVRTPSFLVRFFPLERERLDEEAMLVALGPPDANGPTLRKLLHHFMHFLVDRCGAEDRYRYIAAVKRIQTGAHFGVDVAQEYEDDELQGARSESLVPNVRLVNGTTQPETRQRLMLAFNTPFHPEILVASNVMAEGVDLHLNCRYVLHHDLCWNPSTLEQRTGRVDRIGAKAETDRQPIHVYIPFVSETQDEKMYRVVMDRERWFNVVMGEDYKVDARTTEKLASRIPLPVSAATELTFKLSLVGPVETS
jgi:ERCC4-related helicase